MNTVPYTWPAFSAKQAKAGLKKDGAPNAARRTRGSRLFQVSTVTWLWRFGRPIARAMSVADAQERRAMVWAARSEAIAKSKQEKRSRKGA